MLLDGLSESAILELRAFGDLFLCFSPTCFVCYYFIPPQFMLDAEEQNFHCVQEKMNHKTFGIWSNIYYIYHFKSQTKCMFLIEINVKLKLLFTIVL